MYMMKREPRYNIDFNKKVYVYKNLHKNCWSVKQGGLVKAHALELNLYACSMKVSQAGQRRVRSEKRKNVHAGIHGYLEPYHLGLSHEAVLNDEVRTFQRAWEGLPNSQMREITYNPYKYDSFVHVDDETPRWFGSFVRLLEDQVFIA